MSDRVDAHLRRIGLRSRPAPDLDGLREVHLAHATTVPFENLDIIAGRPLSLDLDALHDKVVVRRRGGFCFELNGLAHALLVELGFDAVLVEGRGRLTADRSPDEDGEDTGEGDAKGDEAASGGEEATGDGDAPPDSLGPRWDHCRVLVDLGPQGRWLLDVGNGASAMAPLPVDGGEVVDDGPTARRVVPDDDRGGFWTQEMTADGGWSDEWFSDPTPRQLSDFTVRCHHHQTSPDSHFTQGMICTLPTPTGKVALTADKLITTAHGVRQEAAVVDWRVPLRDVFGIVLDEG